jgi:hypothetical protein
VWAVTVVIVLPGADLFPDLTERREQGLVQQLISEPAVEAFHEAVLHGLARRDVMSFNTNPLAP